MVDNTSWQNKQLNLTPISDRNYGLKDSAQENRANGSSDHETIAVDRCQQLDFVTADRSPEQIEIFVGNLRPDIERDIIVKQLQCLFSTKGVVLDIGDFSVLYRGPKRAKHLFVVLKSEEDRQELISLFNGLKDLDFIAANKILRITERNKKPIQARKRKKRAESSDLVEDGNVLQNRSMVIQPALSESKSAPSMVTLTSNVSSDMPVEGLRMGETLQTENRRTEYKRGGGKYMKKTLTNHVRRYVCAFLNSEGGKLLIGVADGGKVYGVPCTRKQEDCVRILIDSAIGKFQPPVFPAMYSVRFIPVIPCGMAHKTDNNDECFKVLQIEVQNPTRTKTLYETDRGEVYIRRDGSVQGPLKASQIIEWCRLNQIQSTNTHHIASNIQDNAITTNVPNTDPDGTLKRRRNDSIDSTSLKPTDESLIRISELEASINSRQEQLEKEIDAIKLSYEMREKILQEELEKSRYELEKRRRPSSAVCIIL